MAWRAITMLGGGCFLLTLCAYVQPNFLCLVTAFLALLGLAVTLVFAVILGVGTWRQSSRLWMMPALTSLGLLLSIRLAPPIGRLITDWRFRRNVSEYNRVVEEVRSGAISCIRPCNDRFTTTNAATLPTNVAALLAAHCDEESIVVAFLSRT